MNDSIKMNILLDRIAQRVSARRDEAYLQAKAASPDDVDNAYQQALTDIRWGDTQDSPLSMSQDEMEDLVSALECCGPFGPIHKAAIDLAAFLTGCNGLIEHNLTASVRFSCTHPDQLKGSVAEFQAKLHFGMGLHDSYRRHAKLHGVTTHTTSVDVNEGYLTIRGELTFALDVFNEGEPPSAKELQELLSVTICTDRFGAPQKYERTPVRSLEILSSVTH